MPEPCEERKTIDDAIIRQSKILSERHEIEQNQKSFAIHRIVSWLTVTLHGYEALRTFVTEAAGHPSEENLSRIRNHSKNLHDQYAVFEQDIKEEFAPVSGFVKNAALRAKLADWLYIYREPALSLSTNHPYFLTGDGFKIVELIDDTISRMNRLIVDLNEEVKKG